MRSGIEELLTWLRFDRAIENADLEVTGEGKLDSQSLQGKVISGIVAHARRASVPVAVICGRIELSEEELRSLGVTHVLEAGKGQALDYAMAHAEENYLEVARELFALVDNS
jgi:glycerate kinase